MITFEKLLKRAESEQIAIHTPTEKQAKTLLKALDKRGYKWRSGTKLTSASCYDVFKENTCYNFSLDKQVWYDLFRFCQKEKYTIIEFDNISLKEKKMITFKKLLERAKSERMAIHTATEDQAITLLKALDKKGYTWRSGAKLTSASCYDVFKENTCYDFYDCEGNLLDKKIVYSLLDYYQDEGYTIIEFENIL